MESDPSRHEISKNEALPNKPTLETGILTIHVDIGKERAYDLAYHIASELLPSFRCPIYSVAVGYHPAPVSKWTIWLHIAKPDTVEDTETKEWVEWIRRAVLDHLGVRNYQDREASSSFLKIFDYRAGLDALGTILYRSQIMVYNNIPFLIQKEDEVQLADKDAWNEVFRELSMKDTRTQRTRLLRLQWRFRQGRDGWGEFEARFKHFEVHPGDPEGYLD